MTEEEEDEEYLKEEEDALAGTGGTRLVSQPLCELLVENYLKLFF
jgi:SWI/SNF-related matrix-associated actin-dependent regulator of chromatin subfamily A member 5